MTSLECGEKHKWTEGPLTKGVECFSLFFLPQGLHTAEFSHGFRIVKIGIPQHDGEQDHSRIFKVCLQSSKGQHIHKQCSMLVKRPRPAILGILPRMSFLFAVFDD